MADAKGGSKPSADAEAIAEGLSLAGLQRKYNALLSDIPAGLESHKPGPLEVGRLAPPAPEDGLESVVSQATRDLIRRSRAGSVSSFNGGNDAPAPSPRVLSSVQPTPTSARGNGGAGESSESLLRFLVTPAGGQHGAGQHPVIYPRGGSSSFAQHRRRRHTRAARQSGARGGEPRPPSGGGTAGRLHRIAMQRNRRIAGVSGRRRTPEFPARGLGHAPLPPRSPAPRSLDRPSRQTLHTLASLQHIVDRMERNLTRPGSARAGTSPVSGGFAEDDRGAGETGALRSGEYDAPGVAAWIFIALASLVSSGYYAAGQPTFLVANVSLLVIFSLKHMF